MSVSREHRASAASIETAHRDTLNALQGLRGLAALLVVCDHAIIDSIAKAGAVGTPEFAWYLGGLGVKVFFAISGFVMIYAHRKDFGVPGAPRKFAFRRIDRIVPLY